MESKVSRREEAIEEHVGAPVAGSEPELDPPQPPTGRSSESRPGLKVRRVFTRPDQDPYETLEWERRSAVISGEDGRVVFEQKDIEVPRSWSQLALNVVASKYFRGSQKRPGERENSVRQLIARVADSIAAWGRQDGYFASAEDADSFQAELAYLLVHQKASFNSPVWFNVGVEAKPQCSACFINSVQDSMSSILKLAHTEGMLFKHGSGTGTNLSPLRSSKEELAGGGEASGPVSFMKGYDAFAGVIKSGGKTRRAAKMVILNIDHPDVVEFIKCKKEEEEKAWALIDAGYDGSFNGVAYSSIFYQNSNNSVRVTDEFMRAFEEDGEWHTRAITDGRTLATYRARDLMRQIAEAAWVCGDPGMQYDTTVNAWHTCLNTSRINASNPCSEYMFIDDSACNLASLNLMKFVDPNGEFDVVSFRHAVDILITAMEIIVPNSSYPTPAIERNSHEYRPLGLGYANLGALLMARGLAYDSDGGRDYAAAITALLSGQGYLTSAKIARSLGPFPAYPPNQSSMLEVMRKHRRALGSIEPAHVPLELLKGAREAWDQALEWGEAYGFRNAQISVLAPTGTIGFMMDCDTTGVEPDIALIKYKKLVGGGLLKIVNNTVPIALRRLGYDANQIGDIVAYIDEHETIEGAPHLTSEQLPVFDCAFKPQSGERSIHHMGHVRMMAAVQPFISGAISKTVNMPADATADEIMRVYHEAWKLGLKAIAIYRDGCKRTQPLNTGRAPSVARSAAVAAPALQATGFQPNRRKMPDTRRSITHKFSVGGHEGYITVGIFPDGNPGEIFLVMSKEGSVVSGLMDSFATAISLALQYGVPLTKLVDHFSHTRFEPSGFTKNPEIPYAKSLVDYIFRWLASQFLHPEQQAQVGVVRDQPEAGDNGSGEAPVPAPAAQPGRDKFTFKLQTDAPPCHVCGSIMVRGGTCYKCLNCGATSGCS